MTLISVPTRFVSCTCVCVILRCEINLQATLIERERDVYSRNAQTYRRTIYHQSCCLYRPAYMILSHLVGNCSYTPQPSIWSVWPARCVFTRWHTGWDWCSLISQPTVYPVTTAPPRVGWGGGRAPALVSGWPSWPLAVRYWARAPVYTMAPASGLYITSVHGARGTLWWVGISASLKLWRLGLLAGCEVDWRVHCVVRWAVTIHRARD